MPISAGNRGFLRASLRLAAAPLSARRPQPVMLMPSTRPSRGSISQSKPNSRVGESTLGNALPLPCSEALLALGCLKTRERAIEADLRDPWPARLQGGDGARLAGRRRELAQVGLGRRPRRRLGLGRRRGVAQHHRHRLGAAQIDVAGVGEAAHAGRRATATGAAQHDLAVDGRPRLHRRRRAEAHLDRLAGRAGHGLAGRALARLHRRGRSGLGAGRCDLGRAAQSVVAARPRPTTETTDRSEVVVRITEVWSRPGVRRTADTARSPGSRRAVSAGTRCHQANLAPPARRSARRCYRRRMRASPGERRLQPGRRRLLKLGAALRLAPAAWLAASLAAPARAAGAFSRVRPGDPAWPDASRWKALRGRRRRLAARPAIAVRRLLAAPRHACAQRFASASNPYVLSDDPALTQTFGWVDAWVSRRRAPMPWRRERTADVVAAVNFARDHRSPAGRQGRRPQLPGHVERSRLAARLDARHVARSTLRDAFVPQGCAAGRRGAAVSVERRRALVAGLRRRHHPAGRLRRRAAAA